MSEERRVPVQGDGNYNLRHDDSRRGNAHYPGTVSWDEHCEAWVGYAKRYSGQSAERIAERGGFGYDEMTEYMGHEPKTWRVHDQFKERYECRCVPSADGVWFGPCADGKNHQNSCPVAKAAMKAAKWPCGTPVYPEMQDKEPQ